MSSRTRTRLFLVAGLVFLGLYGYASLNMPAWGEYRGPYGDSIARLAVWERHTTDTVNAINYDYRGFDTLGEEYILFTAVLGVMMLLRREHDEPLQQHGQLNDEFKLSATVRAINLPVLLLTLGFGFYIGLHGQLTPGGGFQAGVILATCPVLMYVCENIGAFKRITTHTGVEVIEALGAGGYAMIGLAPLLSGLPLLTNILPLGTTGDVFSSGTIAVISATVGVEVTAAFILVIYTYLQEIIAKQEAEE
jgi:multicomponent Na+:H+ antiporter subunit B